ncbi:hypothetical protein P305_01230 [Xylella fastidiosa subsp. fastidiosa Mus-1]|nr:hypothetical protein P305_01230 [Xylella fastidiosa subsp. fastidiosa Mus-1]
MTKQATQQANYDATLSIEQKSIKIMRNINLKTLPQTQLCQVKRLMQD